MINDTTQVPAPLPSKLCVSKLLGPSVISNITDLVPPNHAVFSVRYPLLVSLSAA